MEPAMTRHDSVTGEFEIMKPDHEITMVDTRVGFFSLPAEIRIHIYELVFKVDETYDDAFNKHGIPDAPVQLWQDYSAAAYLRPLETCRQFYEDAHLLAFSRTLFVVMNPYRSLNINAHLEERLRPESIASLRHIAFVADARHLRKIQVCHWKNRPFNQPLLQLSELSIILHRSSYWHYLFDYNFAMVSLFRNLEGVKKLTFVRNNSSVKGTLFTWYNGLVRMLLKADHAERFSRYPPCPETTWWAWNYCARREICSLTVQPAKCAALSQCEYADLMAPLYRTLAENIVCQEEDPDPMSRVSA